MEIMRFCLGGNSPSQYYAGIFLSENFPVTREPDGNVTHLLLPVPAFGKDGKLTGGQDPGPLLQALPENITVIGGRLAAPRLDGYKKIDLLEDPRFLCENAAITAQCALRYGMENLPLVVSQWEALVIGWGRIGKALSLLLKNLGAKVTVYARKEADRAQCQGLGLEAVSTIDSARYRVIFNTVPAMLLETSSEIPLKIDLASVPGIGGNDVIRARFLPGRDAPESTGRLICSRVCQLIRKEAEP